MTDSAPPENSDFRDRIQHPDLRTLYDYWDQRRRGRRWPARADINPVDLKFALGNLTLVDVHHDPLRFKFRLSGTLFAQRVGMDLTGKWVDEIPDEAYRNEVIERYRQVVDTGQPQVTLSERDFDGQPRKFEILRLPLSDDDKIVNMLLICPLYFEKPPADPVLGRQDKREFTPPRTIKND
jgi:hypothetical protein